MTDAIADIIGDYGAFAVRQRDRLLALGIDIAPYELSHIAFRVPEWDQYVHVRTLLERHASANRENFWNGRPISLILENYGGLPAWRRELPHVSWCACDRWLRTRPTGHLSLGLRRGNPPARA